MSSKFLHSGTSPHPIADHSWSWSDWRPACCAFSPEVRLAWQMSRRLAWVD